MGFFDENRIVPFPFTGILSLLFVISLMAAFTYLYKTNSLQSVVSVSSNFLDEFYNQSALIASASASTSTSKLELIAPFVGPIIWALIAASVIAAIVFMSKKNACTSSSPIDAARYEGFASKSEIRSLIKQGQKAVDRVNDTLDTIMNAADDTCSMLKDAEEMYVGNLSAPKTDEEANLPENERNSRIDDRKKRAKKRFIEERKIHASLKSETFKKHGVYECFEDVASQPEETYMQEFNEVKLSLKTVLDNSEVKLATIRIDQLQTALDFINRLYEKNNQANAAAKEGFESGDQDIIEMEALLEREQKFYNASRELLKYVKSAKEIQQGTYKVANEFENGKIDQDTAKALLPVPKPIQGKCADGLYQYALYSGGFCCQEPPTNYDMQHKDFSTCSLGACSQNPETVTNQIPLCS
jgi:hypothetical protein